MTDNELSGVIIGACIKIHRALGPGLLESAYQKCLHYELEKIGLHVEVEKYLPLIYEDMELESAYRIDLIVNNKIVIELKSVSQITEVHWAQVLTYLKLGKYKLGLLINFNEVLLKDGVHRIVNGL